MIVSLLLALVLNSPTIVNDVPVNKPFSLCERVKNPKKPSCTNEKSSSVDFSKPAISSCTKYDGTSTSQTKECVSLISPFRPSLIDAYTPNQITQYIRSKTVGIYATDLMARRYGRMGFSVQVQSDSAKCYIAFNNDARTDNSSLMIMPNTLYDVRTGYITHDRVSIICTEEDTPVYAVEW